MITYNTSNAQSRDNFAKMVAALQLEGARFHVGQDGDVLTIELR